MSFSCLSTDLPTLLHGANLYLIGMMGSGKTTIGQRLAQSLAYGFIDTDRLIEQVSGQAIPDLFANEGEAGFRRLETQVLAEVASYTRLVIATGGGIVLARSNWSYLRHGVIVWLDVAIPQLVERLAGDRHRPLLQQSDPQETLAAILQQRQALYAQADLRLTVPAEEAPAKTVERLLTLLPTILALPLAPPLATDLN